MLFVQSFPENSSLPFEDDKAWVFCESTISERSLSLSDTTASALMMLLARGDRCPLEGGREGLWFIVNGRTRLPAAGWNVSIGTSRCCGERLRLLCNGPTTGDHLIYIRSARRASRVEMFLPEDGIGCFVDGRDGQRPASQVVTREKLAASDAYGSAVTMLETYSK